MLRIFFSEMCTENGHSGCPGTCCVVSRVGRDERAYLPLRLGRCSAALAGTPKTGFREDNRAMWMDLLEGKRKVDKVQD